MDFWKEVAVDFVGNVLAGFLLLGDIGYLRDKQPIHFDNKSVWGMELKPGTITHAEAAPVTKLAGSLSGLEGLQVHVYLQNGRHFWLRGAGPGALKIGRIQKAAFWLRKQLETGAVPME